MIRVILTFLITGFITIGSSQSGIRQFSLSNENDSILMIEEYYPDINIQRLQEMDLSSVTAGCSKLLSINKQGDLLTHSRQGKLISAYRTDEYGMRVEYDHEIVERFDQFGDVTMTNLSNNYLIDFPILDRQEPKKDQEHSYNVVINNPDKGLGDYNRITIEVFVTQSIDISERSQVKFPFGNRLTVVASVFSKYTIGRVYGYQKSDKIKIDADLFKSQLPEEPIEMIYFLNQYRGILLADLKVVNDTPEKVRIFQERQGFHTLEECIDDQQIFQLYPNPTYGDIQVLLNYEQQGTYKIEVFSIIAKLLYSETLNHNSPISKFPIRLPQLTKGTYLYSIIDPNGKRMFTRRLMVLGY